MPPFSRSPWLLVAFGALLIATGTLSAYRITIEPVLGARAARAWSETTCHVTYSQVTIDRRGKHRAYHAAIAYQYEVGGRRYTGSRVSFTSASGTSGEAEEITARYPLGWDTPCWYDPANPASATLSRSVPESFWAALHPLLLFGGLGMLTWGARQGRDRRRSGLPKLLATAWIAAAIGAIGYFAFDVGHATTGVIAYGVVVVTVGWFARELRAALRR